jgi:HemY protein
MTDKKDDTSKGTSPTPASQAKPGDPKRPHATIDLKATEVPSKMVKPDIKPDAPSVKPTEPIKSTDPLKSDAKPATANTATAPFAPTPSAKPEPVKPDASPAKSSDGKTGEKVKSAVVPPPTTPRAKTSGIGSMISHVLAGLIGGTAAWYGAQIYGPELGLPVTASETKATEALAKYAELKKLIDDKGAIPIGAANGSDVSGKLAAAQAQIVKLEASAKTVTDLSAAQAKLAADTKTLTDKLAEQSGADGAASRLAKLEERLKLMSESAAGDPQPGKLPQIAALSGRIVDLESTMANQVSALRKTVSQELEQRLSLTNETSEAAKSGTNRMDRELATVKAEVAASAQKFDTVRSDTDRLTSAVQAMRDDTNGLKTTIDAVKSDIEAKYKAVAKPADVASAVAPMAGKLASLEQNVATVVKAEDERKSNSERILLALELNNLKRVLDRGQPFAAELAEVTKASGGKVDLSVLESYKNGTVATLADLSREFRETANAMIDADVEGSDGSVMGRMIEGAKSVIRVRRVDLKPDDKSAEAVVGRMDKALQDGRVADVLTESGKLSAKSQNVAKSWLDKVKARAAVDRAIGTLEAALKTSLGGACRCTQIRRQLVPLEICPSPPSSERKSRVMIRVILFLLACLGAATGMSWLADRHGTVSIVWEGRVIETSVFHAVVVSALIIGSGLILLTILRQVWNSPAVIGSFMNRRRQQRGLESLSSGMIAIGAGDRAAATRYAIAARKSLPNEPLTQLLRAQAAQLSGDKATSRRIFEAMLAAPDTEQLGLRGLFIEAQREKEPEAARQFAARALKLNPKLAWASDALFEIQCKDGLYEEALETLSLARRNSHIERALADRREAVLLTGQALQAEDGDPAKALNLAIKAHGLAPDLVPAASLAGRMLASRGNTGKAAKILHKTWARSPHPDIATAYAFARIGDSPRDRLERIRQLAALNPHSVESAIAVANAAIDAKEFDVARSALEPVLDNRLTQRVATLMARIESEQHGDKGRVREWLARAVNAERDPVWTADGITSEQWSPVSPITGQLDAFQWRVPVEAHLPSDTERVARRVEELMALGAPAAALEPVDVTPVAPAVPTPLAKPVPQRAATLAQSYRADALDMETVDDTGISARPSGAPANTMTTASAASPRSGSAGKSDGSASSVTVKPAKPAVVAPLPASTMRVTSQPEVKSAVGVKKDARTFVTPHAPDDPGLEADGETPLSNIRPPYRAVP